MKVYQDVFGLLHTYIQTDRQTDRETDRQTDRQTREKTDEKRNFNRFCYCCIVNLSTQVPVVGH